MTSLAQTANRDFNDFFDEFYAREYTDPGKLVKAAAEHSQILSNPLWKIIDEYRGPSFPPRFGAHFWKKYLNVDAGHEPDLPESFYIWREQPDLLDKSERNKDTHYPPVLAPRFLLDLKTNTLACRSLDTLYKLGLPLTWPYTKLDRLDETLLEDVSKLKGGPSCWLVLHKPFLRLTGCMGTHPRCELDRLGYENPPSSLDFLTVALAFKTLKEWPEREYIDDSNGVIANCVEKVEGSTQFVFPPYDRNAIEIYRGLAGSNNWSIERCPLIRKF